MLGRHHSKFIIKENAKEYQKWYANKKNLSVEKKLYVGKTFFDLVLNPPGKFWMGSSKSSKYLSKLPYALPTEAQWEYACRAGTLTRFYRENKDNYNQINNFALLKNLAGT